LLRRAAQARRAAPAAAPPAPPSFTEAMMADRFCAAIAGLIDEKTCELAWQGPFGLATVTITDTVTFFNRHHVIDIGVPRDTPFPLETLSYIATAMEIERAGGAAGFVESLIAAAERTNAWREYAARSREFPSRAPHPPAPCRPRPGRRRLKLRAPQR
jgi:hypothetical protein